VKFVPPQKLYDEKFVLPINDMENKNWMVYRLQHTPTDATDVNPLRRSSRIAERRAKSEQLTKSTKDSVTNRTNENNIQINDDPAPDRLDLEPASTPTFIPISKPISEPALTLASTSSFRAPFPDKTTNEIFDELRNVDPCQIRLTLKRPQKKFRT